MIRILFLISITILLGCEVKEISSNSQNNTTPSDATDSKPSLKQVVISIEKYIDEASHPSPLVSMRGFEKRFSVFSTEEGKREADRLNALINNRLKQLNYIDDTIQSDAAKALNELRKYEAEREKKLSNNQNQSVIPKFTLACSYGIGNENNNFYRFVSDGKEIYFGHANGSVYSKSQGVITSDRLFSFKQLDFNGIRYSSNINTEIQRDTLKVFITRIDFTGKEENRIYICENIDDENIIKLIKSDFETKQRDAQEKQRLFDNRPNKI